MEVRAVLHALVKAVILFRNLLCIFTQFHYTVRQFPTQYCISCLHHCSIKISTMWLNDKSCVYVSFATIVQFYCSDMQSKSQNYSTFYWINNAFNKIIPFWRRDAAYLVVKLNVIWSSQSKNKNINNHFEKVINELIFFLHE